MKRASKFNKLSPEPEEVPNAELHAIKGGNQEQNDQMYTPTVSLHPDDEQLLIYGSSRTPVQAEREMIKKSTLAHELAHVGQFLDGDYGFSSSGEHGNASFGIEEEIDAYQFQHIFMNFSDGSQIDSQWVQDLEFTNNNGTSKPYENLQEGQACPVHG
ncbi:hypothetical protein [Pedobacter sp. UBA4863]|uniref:hypothetical protein n=1 Tax=Pedobacter sp. UBA4863 TaxID=1947060 RepID=UPI0025F7D5B9|nr:hypothetical protein [Pedobacter sp. UBA4863]